MSKFILGFLLITLTFCEQFPNWNNGESSIPVLLNKTLSALRDNKDEELKILFLSKDEHRVLFWKHTGERFTQDKGMSADSAYDFMSMETNLSIQTLKKRITGTKEKNQFMGCKRSAETYGPFRLHLGCEIVVYDSDNKEELIKNIYGIIEYKESFKLYNFKRN